MLKEILIVFSLILIPSSTLFASVYRCTLLDGTVVYGDKPVYVSDEYCQEVTATDPQKVFTNPSQRSGTQRPPVTNSNPKPAAKQVRDNPKTAPSTFHAIKARAVTLLKDYREARTKRYRASYLTDKQKAMREIKAIKKEKATLLAEVAKAAFTPSEQEEVTSLLGDIP